ALDELLAVARDGLAHRGGNLAFGRLVVRVGVRLAGDEIHHAAQTRLLADGDRQRGDAGAEVAAQRFERAVVGRVLAVELVDESEARQAVFVSVAPGQLRANLDALFR